MLLSPSIGHPYIPRSLYVASVEYKGVLRIPNFQSIKIRCFMVLFNTHLLRIAYTCITDTHKFIFLLLMDKGLASKNEILFFTV